MKKCPERSNVTLDPIKIPTVDEFLAFPLLSSSSCARMNLERHEQAIVEYIEGEFEKKFYICPYCEKRTQFGYKRDTKVHMYN